VFRKEVPLTIANDPYVQDGQNVEDISQDQSELQLWRYTDTRPVTVRPQQVITLQSVRRTHLIKATRLIWLAAMMLEFLLAMRFFLKLLGANPSAGFAIFDYNISAPFLAPFFGLTVMPSAGGVVLEFPTLIAMAVYAVWAWLIIRIVWVVFDEPVAA
jgi:hypothetical protein